MSISIEKLLRHMQWANQGIYRAIAELPDQALGAYLVNPEWTVAEILRHTATSNSWYFYRLTGGERVTLEEPKSMDHLNEIADQLLVFDQRLIALAEESEHRVTVVWSDKSYEFDFSTILSQAVHHSIEHRAQAVAALESRGFTTIKLDDFDLWSFERSTR
jgi:uncharacterized damage-inducible protein DinB